MHNFLFVKVFKEAPIGSLIASRKALRIAIMHGYAKLIKLLCATFLGLAMIFWLDSVGP